MLFLLCFFFLFFFFFVCVVYLIFIFGLFSFCYVFFFQRKPNIFYPPAPSIANRCNLVALNFPNPTVPAPLRAAGQVLPLPPPRCRKRSEAPTVSHLIAKVKRRLQDPYHSVWLFSCSFFCCSKLLLFDFLILWLFFSLSIFETWFLVVGSISLFS